jgi:prevent-host-death family protein
MESIGVYEAKTHLARLLDEVERGETITITKHGRAVARLAPIDAGAMSTDLVISALREERRGVRRGRNTARKLIEEGQR